MVREDGASSRDCLGFPANQRRAVRRGHGLRQQEVEDCATVRVVPRHQSVPRFSVCQLHLDNFGGVVYRS